MRRIWCGMVMAVMLLLAATGTGGAAQPVPGAEYVPGEIIIKYKKSADVAASSALHRKHGSKSIREFRTLGMEHVRIKGGQSMGAAITAFESNSAVAYAEPNYIVQKMVDPSDAYWSKQWGMAKISAPAAWDNSTGSFTVVIGTIDSGIDYNHPDLYGNIWTGADGSHGYNALTNTNDPMDDNGHGTHVAGIIGAMGNTANGVTGVNWNVKIMACKFLDSTGKGTTSNAIECLNYFRKQKDAGVNIIATNNSWGGGGYSQAFYDAIKSQQDILFIASAGNKGTNNDITASYPGNYELPNVLSVAATDVNDALASFSQYGKYTVDIAAPGVGIFSTYLSNSYASLSGTSMAAPHVTGLAGLIKAAKPSADWRTVKNLILSSGDDVPSLGSKILTGKRVNAYKALTCTDSRFLSAIQYPKKSTVGTPANLSALSINCGEPSGPVTVTLSDGEVVVLADDGVSPDLMSGDGVFTATFIPKRVDESFYFVSPSGSDNVAPVPPLLFSTSTLSGATTGVIYDSSLAATGGVAPYAWSLLAGSLPAGLSLDFKGSIKGIPATAGTYNFSVQVADSSAQTVSGTLSLTVAESAQKLVVTTTSLPPASRIAPYTFTLTAAGDAAPVTWSIASGRLPNGLFLDSSSGVISGASLFTGTFAFTVRARDVKGGSALKGLTLSVTK